MNRRLSSPRAKIVTSQNGAWPGSVGPGCTVVKENVPSRSTKSRPQPVNSQPLRTREPVRCGIEPSRSACQISIIASGTGCPAPSRTVPKKRIAPGTPTWTSSLPPPKGRPLFS